MNICCVYQRSGKSSEIMFLITKQEFKIRVRDRLCWSLLTLQIYCLLTYSNITPHANEHA